MLGGFTVVSEYLWWSKVEKEIAGFGKLTFKGTLFRSFLNFAALALISSVHLRCSVEHDLGEIEKGT